MPGEIPSPWPVVIVPVGHSGKQFQSYQIPCQVFARCGYLAICFDPPGMRGEHARGNDHWRDGVRPWLLGESATRFFVADALRCIDYATTREDTDLSNGVAMTGVSGGGKTTMFAGSLDERIGVLGPCCCLSPMGEADIAMNLPPCPEVYTLGRFKNMLDDIDFLLAAMPSPICMLAGTQDALRTPERTKAVFDTVQRLYKLYDAGESVDLFLDESPHAYTFAMARHFVQFADRWLRREPERELPMFSATDCEPVDTEVLQCYPNPDVNMYTLCRGWGRQLASRPNPQRKTVVEAVRRLNGVQNSTPPPACRKSQTYRTLFKTRELTELLLCPESEIELPGMLVSPVADVDPPCGALLFIDAEGRWQRLRHGGPLTRVVRSEPPGSLLSVDLPGWGETAPIAAPTEVYGWTHPMRGISYMSAALGDHLLGMRIRDALNWLTWLRHYLGQELPIVLGGAGLGGVIALHVAVLDEALAGVYCEAAPASFQELLEAQEPAWRADAYLPGALLHYDLPDLVRACNCPVHLHDVRTGNNSSFSVSALRNLYHGVDSSHITAVDSSPNPMSDFCRVCWDVPQ